MSKNPLGPCNTIENNSKEDYNYKVLVAPSKRIRMKLYAYHCFIQAGVTKTLVAHVVPLNPIHPMLRITTSPYHIPQSLKIMNALKTPQRPHVDASEESTLREPWGWIRILNPIIQEETRAPVRDYSENPPPHPQTLNSKASTTPLSCSTPKLKNSI